MTKVKVKRKLSKEALHNIREGGKKRRGKKHHAYSNHKAKDGVKKSTAKERAAFLNPRYMHEYPAPYLGNGVPKAFETPEHLRAGAEEYFTWCQKNPWYRAEWRKDELVDVPVARVFTMTGLCIRLGVSEDYFSAFQNNLKKDDPYRAEFLRIIKYIKACIYSNKFEGASGGFYNANLISYDLGLRREAANGTGTGGGVNIVIEGIEANELLESVMQQIKEIDEQAESNV